jgi:two-component system OmpR family response regulator/two-component system copper resistance phosphate regulon response regulator CusR
MTQTKRARRRPNLPRRISQMDVLVVEDDEVLGRAVRRGLEEAGHRCTWVKNGEKALNLATAQKCDALLLDLMLPDCQGLEVLREIRARGIGTPVLVVTALGSVEERVEGLNAGADDYLIKPFSFPELLARLSAISRRSLNLNSQQLKAGPLSLDLSTRRVTRDNVEIDLTPTEFSLLEFLMRNAGQVLTRKMLSEHLWDSDWEGVTNVIEVHITRLRGKIDRDFNPPLLQTIRGRGYVLRTGED